MRLLKAISACVLVTIALHSFRAGRRLLADV